MLANMMIHIARVERSTEAPTSFSTAGTKTWAPIFPVVACQIQPISAREAVIFSREQQAISHTMYVASGIDVRPGDRVYYAGKPFSVVGIRNIDYRDRLTTINLMELTNVAAT